MEKIFEYNKGKISYQFSGKGNETLVFIHGFSMDYKMWRPQVAHFLDKYKVLTYDMRGFGVSSLPIAPYSHAEDLYNLLTYLRIEKLNLVGLSLGGEIAVDFTILYPNLVNKLVLMDSSLGGYSSTVDWTVHAKEKGLLKAKENWVHHKVFEKSIENPNVRALLELELRDYSGWHWLNTDPRIKLNPPAIERLNSIVAKTLIILGENDLDYYHNISEILLTNIQDSKREIIRASGHLVNLEKTDEVNELLTEFLE